MDTRTGRIYEFDNDDKLAMAQRENQHLVCISREERRKLARYEESSRPVELVRLRSISKDRNKAKADRKARRANRGK